MYAYCKSAYFNNAVTNSVLTPNAYCTLTIFYTGVVTETLFTEWLNFITYCSLGIVVPWGFNLN